MNQQDYEMNELERQLEQAESEEERRALLRDMRDLERAGGDRERWEDEGREKGYF